MRIVLLLLIFSHSCLAQEDFKLKELRKLGVHIDTSLARTYIQYTHDSLLEEKPEKAIELYDALGPKVRKSASAFKVE